MAALAVFDTNKMGASPNAPQGFSTQTGGRSSVGGVKGFLEDLLPVGGAVLGTLLAPETGGLSAIAATALLGGAGSALGKIGENAVQTGKSNLLGGVGEQALMGAAGGAAGGVIGDVAGRLGIDTDSTVGRLVGVPEKYAKEPAVPTTTAENEAVTGATADLTKETQTPTSKLGQSIYNKGSSIRANVRGLQQTIEKEPGSALNVAGRAHEVNQWADNYIAADGTKPFTGSAVNQASKVPQVKSEIDSDLEQALANDPTRYSQAEVGSKIIARVKADPQYAANPEQMSKDANTALSYMHNDEGTGIADQNEDGKMSSSDLNRLKQAIDSNPKMKFNRLGSTASNPADADTTALMASRSAVRDMIHEVNPQASKAIDDEHNLETLAKGLNASSRQQSGVGGIRIGATPRLAKPIGGNAIQSIQEGAGRALQEVGMHPEEAVAGGLFHQGLTRGVLAPAVNKISQDQTMNKLNQQGITSQSLAHPSSEVAQLLDQVQQNGPQISGLPSVADIQKAELEDMETTGGKNMPELEKLQTLATAQAGNSLTGTAAKQVTNYQQALGDISSLAAGFENGKVDTGQLQQAIDDMTKQIETNSGISGKAFASLLPSVTDSPAVALQKLASLKQAMDTQVSNTLQSSLSSNSTNSASTIDDLVSQISGGQAQTSTVPPPLTALPGQ